MTDAIRVLLADDEVCFASSLSKVLSRRGFQVTAVHSGEEALAELERETFDVILLDLRMPRMDGLETLSAIRRRDETLPVLILSGHADLPSVTAALGKGIANFVSKPCAVEVLVTAIEDAHERKALADTARRHMPTTGRSS